MKKRIGNMFGNFSTAQRSRRHRLRRLQLETLEGRRLLAADLAYHNYLIAEDVNEDFRVSPLDALLVVNALNDGAKGAIGEGEEGAPMRKLDVNGDNVISAVDALLVVNRLNAEGEQHELMTYSFQVTNTAGEPIDRSVVGETFRINVFVQDSRESNTAGVFSAAMDLGVSDLDLVSFERGATFASGVTFGPEFIIGRRASEGGGIQINGNTFPSVSDGQVFSLDAGAGPIVFEFDSNDSFQAGNVPVELPSSSPSFGEVVNAMVEAINGSSLGVTAKNNGSASAVVGLDLDQIVEFDNRTSSLSLSLVEQEYFNEVTAVTDVFNAPDNPGEPILFYSVDFTALSSGTVTFAPNGPDRPGSDNLLFNSTTVIPNEMIDFGAPFAVEIILDPTSPVAVNDNISSPEDTPLIIGANVLANDQVEPGRTLSIDVVSTIPGETQGTVTGNTYTPPQNFFGTDTITYVAIDSTGLRSNIATVTINVTPVNDAPIAADDLLSADEDSTDNVFNLLVDNGNGPDSPGPGEVGQAITITAVGTPSENGTVAIVSASEVSYTPAAGFIGTETFTYTITDAGGLSDTATVTVEVEPGVLPRARNDRATGNEGNSVSVDVLANDSPSEGATLALDSFTQGANGAVVQNGNLLVYTANDPNFFGTDTFTYVITDGVGEPSTGTVTITLNNVNDAPVLTDDARTTAEDTPLSISIASLLANDSAGPLEDDVQSLTLTAVTAITASAGTVAISGGNVVYTPAPDFNGTFEFTYTARDDGTPPLSATATVTVTVTPVNDNPIANSDTVAGVEDTTTTIPAGNINITEGNVLFNDRPGPATAVDEVGQTLTVTGVSSTSAQGGTVALSAGVISYTPAADFNGSDTFTYSLSDGAGGTATGTVTVNVAAVNDAPTAVTDNLTAFADTSLTIEQSTLLANDIAGPAEEPLTQTLTVIAVTANANTNGTVVLNANGTITYRPNPGFTGPASFDYTIQDSGPSGGPNNDQNTDTGTVNVTVQEFVPSDISGRVWVDETRDGIIDARERTLGGVKVTLSGTQLGDPIAPQTVLTLADGSYSFENLGPGRYVVSYTLPQFMLDGADVPGAPGDADSINNQFTVSIDQPGGVDASGYNFAVLGLQAGPGRILEQLASRHEGDRLAGVYMALAADNSLHWVALLDGYSGVQFSEGVLSADGRELFLTVVDAGLNVKTAVLDSTEFVKTTDASGNQLIRILIASEDAEWQAVSRTATPPVLSPNRYLEAIDAIFDQEDWD